MGRAGGRVTRSRPTCSAPRSPGAGSSAQVFVFDPFGLSGARGAHVVAAARGAHLGRRARGRVAARVGRRARPARRRGRRLLGDRRRAAARAAAVRGGAQRRRHRTPSSRWAYGQGAASSTRRSRVLAGDAGRGAARRRARRLRRGPRVRGAGRPHPRLDRGHRAGAAARLPLPARRPLGAVGCEITADRLLDETATLYLIGDAKASKLLRPIFLALLVGGRRPRLRARHAGRRPARAAAAAVPRRGRQRRAAAEPGRDRLDRAEPQHPAGLDLPRPRPGAERATASRRRPSSTATARGCCCRASPTSRRCATSPA